MDNTLFYNLAEIKKALKFYDEPRKWEDLCHNINLKCSEPYTHGTLKAFFIDVDSSNTFDEVFTEQKRSGIRHRDLVTCFTCVHGVKKMYETSLGEADMCNTLRCIRNNYSDITKDTEYVQLLTRDQTKMNLNFDSCYVVHTTDEEFVKTMTAICSVYSHIIIVVDTRQDRVKCFPSGAYGQKISEQDAAYEKLKLPGMVY